MTSTSGLCLCFCTQQVKAALYPSDEMNTCAYSDVVGRVNLHMLYQVYIYMVNNIIKDLIKLFKKLLHYISILHIAVYTVHASMQGMTDFEFSLGNRVYSEHLREFYTICKLIQYNLA